MQSKFRDSLDTFVARVLLTGELYVVAEIEESVISYPVPSKEPETST